MIHSILTSNSLTFVIGSVAHQVSKDSIVFADVVEELKKTDPDEARLVELARPQVKIERELSLAFDSAPNVENYLAKRTVEVTREGVLLDGVRMHGVLVDRMMEMLGLGLPLVGMIRFMENLYMNPTQFARDELYLWLENSDMPITEDGCFLAYKRVRADFTDMHTGTFDNSPGQIVQLKGRHVVDPIRENTCSTGLHFCSKSYLPYFFGAKVMLLKINPADVVSIPSDYGNAKGRTWRYEVLREVDDASIPDTTWAPLTNSSGGTFYGGGAHGDDPVLNEDGIAEYTDSDGNSVYIEEDGDFYYEVSDGDNYADGRAPTLQDAVAAARDAAANFTEPEEDEYDEDDYDQFDPSY